MSAPLIIGINGYVAAIAPEDGRELWRTVVAKTLLGGSTGGDVAVLVKDGVVFAGSCGGLCALDLATGGKLWENKLKGLGYNDVSLALEGISVQFLRKTAAGSSS